MSETMSSSPAPAAGSVCRFPLIIFLSSVVVLLALNAFTQPYEDAISLVAPTKPFYLDAIWYLDDVIGPSFFLAAALTLLRRVRFSLVLWPVVGLALCCAAFAIGDSFDAHWVLPTGLETEVETQSFSSWMSKVMVVIVFCFFIIATYDAFDRKAQQTMTFCFLLIFIDQIIMSISLDFAGYSFHVFEESLEVATSALFCIGVACRPFSSERLKGWLSP